MMVRNKDKTKTPSPILLLLLMIKFSPSLSIPPFENGAEGGYNQLMMHPLCSFLLLTLSPCFSMESLPTRYSLNNLLLCGFLTGSRKPVPDRKPVPTWALSHGLQLLPRFCCDVSSPQLEILSGYLHLPQYGVISGLCCGCLIHCGPSELLSCSSALPLSLPLVFTGLFLTYFSTSSLLKLLCSIFWPFLTAFPKMLLFSCGAQRWDFALPCSESGTQQP